MPTDIARYSIELFKPGGEGAGIEEILDRHADLKIARSIYRTRVEEYPGRLIMLCDHARVLARGAVHRQRGAPEISSARLALSRLKLNEAKAIELPQPEQASRWCQRREMAKLGLGRGQCRSAPDV